MYNGKKSQNDNSENLIDPIIKNSLEYYDQHQPKIQEILNKLEYIEIVNNGNITDQFIFYDSDDNVILKSRYEVLSIYVPQNNIWKWSWSLPTASIKNTFISRKILEYAFTLNPETDYLLKSTLINSKILIENSNQLDIYIGLSAMLSKKPFIFKIYMVPIDQKDLNDKKSNNNDNKNNNIKNLYYYKKIINNNERNNYIALYTFILDWNI